MLHQPQTEAYSEIRGSWPLSTTTMRFQVFAGKPATTASTRWGLVATFGWVVVRPRVPLVPAGITVAR